MSYNGWDNWATWEARNWFGDSFDDLCAEAAESNPDAESACEAFNDAAFSLMEETIDNDLREKGLESSFAMLAGDFLEDKVNFDEIWHAWLGDNPDAFSEEDEDA